MLLSPFRGLLWVFEQVKDQAEKEMYDEDGVKAELTELYQQLESGAITEEVFGSRESELVLRFDEILERKKARIRHGGR
jgi:hypothetical protein